MTSSRQDKYYTTEIIMAAGTNTVLTLGINGTFRLSLYSTYKLIFLLKFKNMISRLLWVFFIVVFVLSIFVSIWIDVLYFLVTIAALFAVGVYDIFQKQSNILRMYPILGHLRYMLQGIRPQIQQYFIETNSNGMPFSRNQREMVYARARAEEDKLPFGTQRDVYLAGFDSINHSMVPKRVDESEGFLTVGGDHCKKPYKSSRLNISGMSFGAISSHAVLALNRGAKLGGFAHNTGEGSISQYHTREGGDLIWQIGTGYFGCRERDGSFCESLYKEKASLDQVKMIELKLSQGAKPAEGGILPAAKITKEIAQIRHVDFGHDVISPPTHSVFNNPIGLLEFIVKLREGSGGKPVGFKLCVGSRTDFLSICKAMVETDIYPDFITVDGAEGGTGAAPSEFSDYVGMPLNEGLTFVNNALVGCNIRDKMKIFASGKVISGFDIITKIALGADACNSARGMMFALGCVQSRKCHNNTCPTGVATQKLNRVYALNVDDKAVRVKNFHNATIESFLDLLGAAGLRNVSELSPKFIYRRIHDSKIKSYSEIYNYLKPGQLFTGMDLPEEFHEPWHYASATSFKEIKENK